MVEVEVKIEGMDKQACAVVLPCSRVSQVDHRNWAWAEPDPLSSPRAAVGRAAVQRAAVGKDVGKVSGAWADDVAGVRLPR